MKRLKPVKVKTIVLRRNGRSVKNTTLYLHPIGSGPPVEASAEDEQETAASLADKHDTETGLLSPTDERPPTLGRMISSAVNWERVRHDLLNASTEEEALPLGVVCSSCERAPASLRCQYCGLRQFFCDECVHNLHSQRINQSLLGVTQFLN